MKYLEWHVCQHVQYFDKLIHLNTSLEFPELLIEFDFSGRLTKGKKTPEDQRNHKQPILQHTLTRIPGFNNTDLKGIVWS